MNLLSLFRRNNSAPVARERLQVLLAHERAFVGQSDLLAVLQEEIIAVIAKHVTIEREKVQIKLDRGNPPAGEISAGRRYLARAHTVPTHRSPGRLRELLGGKAQRIPPSFRRQQGHRK